MSVHYYDQDNINTDLMFPGKYTYESSDPEFIKEHLFEDLDPEFPDKVEEGDIIMVGENFGCGSSREQPAVGLRYVGVRAVVAKSFARIFYRSATNQGLLLIECPEAVEAYEGGNEVTIDEKNGEIFVDDEKFEFPALPEEMRKIIKNGGLLKNIRKNLENN